LKDFPAKNNEQTEKQKAKMRREALGLAYAVDENPPWYVCVTLGFQVSVVLFAHVYMCIISKNYFKQRRKQLEPKIK
jgi:hypothetical protein